MLQLLENAQKFGNGTAIISNSKSYRYSELLDVSHRVAATLMNNKGDLNETRVAFMVNPGFDYVATQWGIWQAGGIAVPICISYPAESIEHVLDDANCSVVVTAGEYFDILKPLVNQRELRIIKTNEFYADKDGLPEIEIDRRAMILYTSGTTGKPKGVVTTHQNIESQIKTLVRAWNWSSDDHILNVLPLHHVHGIINVVSCALWSGATCQFINGFKAEKVFEIFLKGNINVFMAVPTIYYKLIAYWEQLGLDEQKELTNRLTQFRLMISGSAALPVSVMDKWKTISNQTLLERYGMTEIGMAISNPYDGERRPGHIGQPLPGVQVRLVDDSGNRVPNGESGEIQVKGSNVFLEYWKRPEATKESFTTDGWFKTGDVARMDNGSYKILGRTSVDIIKSGGYKLSALEIEEVLRTHPSIKDCGVVGIPHEEWGELVCAGLVASGKIDMDELSEWIKLKLPSYKTPREYKVLDDLPRNVMGKVTKKELQQLFIEAS